MVSGFYFCIMNSIAALYDRFRKNPKVETDSRKDLKGSIFFCLTGPNFDGNKFAGEALEKGAVHVVSDSTDNQEKDGVTIVENTLETLQQLSVYHRRQFSFPVIGLTGSNGKTTNKELITAVLRSKYRTYATRGNLNNHIGVPLTLLSIPVDAEMAVIEMGANHQGEIRDLCALCQPDYGMITNIGKAHLEGFGGVEGVKKGKKELFDFIRANGKKVFVNSDDPVLMEISKGLDRLEFGKNPEENFVSGDFIAANPTLSFRYQSKNEKSADIQTRLVGGYNFYNLLAAACIGTYFEVSATEVKEALEKYKPTNNRSQYVRSKRNDLILDAYNANPSSVKLALENLAKQSNSKKLAILGQMLELGEGSAKEHQEVINRVNALELEAIFVGRGYKNCDLNGHSYFDSTDELIRYLEDKPISNRLILVKGSRLVALENIVPYL